MLGLFQAVLSELKGLSLVLQFASELVAQLLLGHEGSPVLIQQREQLGTFRCHLRAERRHLRHVVSGGGGGGG
jgi:hypothetical protein